MRIMENIKLFLKSLGRMTGLVISILLVFTIALGPIALVYTLFGSIPMVIFLVIWAILIMTCMDFWERKNGFK